MSFYGKIYQEAVNIFNKLKFKNNSKVEFPSSSISDEFILRADGGEDSAVFNAGNKWIQFTRVDDANCKIYHRKTDSETFSASIIIKNKDGTTKADKVISYGDKITFKLPRFDKAGHLAGHDEITVEMVTIDNFEDIKTTIETVGQHTTQIGNNTAQIALIKATASAAQTAADFTAKKNAKEAIDTVQDAIDATTAATKAANEAKTAASNANKAVTNANKAIEDTENEMKELSNLFVQLSGRIAALEAKLS